MNSSFFFLLKGESVEYLNKIQKANCDSYQNDLKACEERVLAKSEKIALLELELKDLETKCKNALDKVNY